MPWVLLCPNRWKCGATQQTSQVSGCHHYPVPELDASSQEPHYQDQTGISVIKLLKGETWVTPRSLVHLTRALVRSRLTYGHEAFITSTDSLWLDLELAELAALKAALGLPRYAINDLVYQEVGWLPLREESRLRCAHFEAVPAQYQTLSRKS